MGNLAAAVTLFVLALVVAFAFVLDQSVTDHTPHAHDDLLPDSNRLDSERSDTFVLTLGRGRDFTKRPKRPRREPIFDPQLHDGTLTPDESKKLVGKGYLPYLIREDDTLSGIAKTYLGDHRLWYLIRDHNPDLMLSADDIRPGMTVRIPTWLGR